MSRWLATAGGIGEWPLAPGTWASLVALPMGVFFLWTGGHWLLLFAAGIACFFGWWASENYTAKTGNDDPIEIVIDEVMGQWIALVPASVSWPDVVLAFVIFRIADIVKPWPASYVDRCWHGGVGVMADDLMAGVYAALILFCLKLGGLS